VTPDPTVRSIMEFVAAEAGVSITDLVSDRRARAISEPRQLVYWLARHLTTKSLPVIGLAIGGRDHTTVMHGLRVVERRRASDADFRSATDRLRAAFEQSSPAMGGGPLVQSGLLGEQQKETRHAV
jgi:chromosomal replication initiator protein